MKLPILIAAATMALAGCQSDQSTLDLSKLNAEQKQEIGEIAGQYLSEHPEFLVQASKNLREKAEQQQNNAMLKAAEAQQQQLTQDPSSPFVGPADAKVTVVEFFDYQCIMCARAMPSVQKLIDENPDVKFVFKESPIFAQRWEASKYAAEAGLWLYKSYGSEAYVKYHDGVFATGKNEGKLSIDDVNKQIKVAGGDISKFKPSNHYMDNLKLFQGLGLGGTPTLFFMPSKNAKADDIVVVPGLAPDRFEAAIEQVKKSVG
ncbi:protein-disulfide isomerase [Sinobacterium caligoides]|uniref:Protein-disulfide isomerase n=1 Tax=Sinobacterium caligoides TaxID=933926 RepID=A0A3N2DY66_9GAMM|nr:thioredoxin domain-containing protein [Sinobacterium caligoides]ROS04612.1 protein-disulfide isomerase [Sinobacterium caligoides]